MVWLALSALSAWFIIFSFIHYFIQESIEEPAATENNNSISVIICARNEERCIENCLRSIENQKDLDSTIHVFLVDDNSEDKTIQCAISASKKLPNIRLTVLNLVDGRGKKASLKLAIGHVQTDFTLITDADCELGDQTIRSQMNRLRNSIAIAAFGPILYSDEGLFSEILSLENINTQAVSEAFFNLGKPIMANAANMMLTKEGIVRFKNSLSNDMASGDDVFFVHGLTPSEFIVQYQESSSVYTKPEKTLTELFHQRIRWASKTTKYDSTLAQGFSALIFLLSALTLSVQIYLVWKLAIGFLIIFTLSKWLIELSFHRSWSLKYSYNHRIFSSFLLSVSYPLWVFIIAVCSLLGIGFQWKGRLYKR
jgi:glycosyltransferase involved in cell wall biosynthesis